ncbi:MAG TPA: glycosyltransferase family 1 protein [Terriglobales bacterium]|nr:glycosyltransferase family 1 protein [Terriglobales bacterium]
MRHACPVITISENSKRDIARYLHVDPVKIKVTYLGVGEEFCHGGPEPIKTLIRRRFGVDQFFLFPGGISPNKNVEGAIKAFAQFRRRRGTHVLVITGIGNPAYTQSLRDLGRDQGIQDRIVWTGSLQRDELPSLYRAADAVIYPSFYEGFGLPILEAMASGCPVIASKYVFAS